MTKKELEDLVKRQSAQISELLEQLRRRPQKEFVPYPTPSTAPTYPWDRDRQIIPTGPCNWPTWPPQTWLSADNKPVCVMEELLNRPCETIQAGGDVL